tara:strand:- start:9 stop:653 length:645 start_codon:yes stop_codon:yes gene_type:complete
LKIKYKTYWRKTGLKKKWGKIFLEIVNDHKPNNFLEIGVFCGVTARNVCELLSKLHKDNFQYTGIDLFGGVISNEENVPNYLKQQRFSNPIKTLYYNFILKENLNSLLSVNKFLKKFSKKIKLIQGNSNSVLKGLDLKNVDFIFLDGGHSFETVYEDLNLIFRKISKNGSSVIVCDDYLDASYITGVKKAVDTFVQKNGLKLELIHERFAKIII